MTFLLSMPGTSEWIIIIFVIGIALIPAIFFLLNLQKTLETISPENRKMKPSNVWLLLIPLFNIIPARDTRPTYNVGLAWNISTLLSFIPLIGPLASVTTFIMYWVKVSEYKNLLIANKGNFMLDAEINA